MNLACTELIPGQPQLVEFFYPYQLLIYLVVFSEAAVDLEVHDEVSENIINKDIVVEETVPCSC